MLDLSKLNDKQLEAVSDTEGVMCVIAGAGSGKTRVLSYRIAALLDKGVAPNHILAITFTTKAAKEMKERVIQLVGDAATDVWLLTFHSLCYRILLQEIKHIKPYEEHFTIYDEDDAETVITASMEVLGIDKKIYSPSMIGMWISRQKNLLHTVSMLKGTKWETDWDELCYRVYVEYQSRLERNNALDYDDLLLLVVRLFISDKTARERWRSRFQYLLVDEYQDTNYAQYILLRALFNKNLCVVGDTDQSIYHFRGADSRVLLSFTKDFPAVKTVKLEQNYRSTRTILDAANAVIAHNSLRQEKNLWSENGVGEPVSEYVTGEIRSESKCIAETITEQLVSGFTWDDIAVLYRMNNQSQLIEKALIRAHIPYVIIGGIPLSKRREVKDFLAYLKIIFNPSDNLSMERVLRFPKKGIGQASIDKLTDYANGNKISLYDACKSVSEVTGISEKVKKAVLDTVYMLEELRVIKLSTVKLIKILRSRLNYPDALKTVEKDPTQLKQKDKRIQFLQTFSQEFPSLEDFLIEIAGLEETEETTGKVKLMTMHAAKGLEFPVVILPNMEEGVFPCGKAEEEGDIEEERRLCYVAFTRAMRRLYIFHSQYRFHPLTKELERREPSRFIGEIPNTLLEKETIVKSKKKQEDAS